MSCYQWNWIHTIHGYNRIQRIKKWFYFLNLPIDFSIQLNTLDEDKSEDLKQFSPFHVLNIFDSFHTSIDFTISTILIPETVVALNEKLGFIFFFLSSQSMKRLIISCFIRIMKSKDKYYTGKVYSIHTTYFLCYIHKKSFLSSSRYFYDAFMIWFTIFNVTCNWK